MNRIIQVILWIFVAINSVHAQETLRFSTIAQNQSVELAKRVIREAYRSIGIDVEIQEFPMERALLKANEGSVDGELARVAGLDKTYPNLIMVPAPLATVTGSAFAKKSTFTLTGWNSLAPYNIGIVIGEKFVELGTQGMKRTAVANKEQLFYMLDAGRVDFVVTETTDGLAVVRKTGIKGIHVLDPPLMTTPVFHYLHKKHQALVPKITVSLEQMKESGRLRALLEQFLAELKGEKKIDLPPPVSAPD